MADFWLTGQTSTESYSFLTAASQLPNNDNDIQQLLEKSMKSERYVNKIMCLCNLS